ncbi:MAG: amidohydrolase [Lachnospiraceae bacterium]|nr:amidohydrolase [Lachnospiraceae bacterium]
MIIDAHLHLWKKQQGMVNGKPVYDIGGGRSDFGGEIRQMLPPYMTDGCNSSERLIANMDYARVQGAVVTQEYIDGNQDSYLLECKKKYQNRLKICSLYEENNHYLLDGFDGIKVCAGRLTKIKLKELSHLCHELEERGMFLSIDLAESDTQVQEMKQLIKECPELRIAIGHFGMVNRKGWESQIELACHKNVFIESGGITWLFHEEFYPYPSAIDAIVKAKEICGIEKLMWGSDYPRTMTAITYLMSRDFVEKSEKLTEEEKHLFLGENARQFYKFEHLPQIPYTLNMVE